MAAEGEEVEGPKGNCESFVVPSQTAEADGQCKTSLHQPAAWRQDEATFALALLGHVHSYVFLRAMNANEIHLLAFVER